MIRKVIFLFSLASLLLFLGLMVMPDLSLATPCPLPMSTSEPIIMWSGPVAEIPKGWQLCDGSNNTPDLSDRFIQGVDTGEVPGQTGGSHDMTLTVDNLPEHKHQFTTSADGEHDHYFYDTCLDGSQQWTGGFVYSEICLGSTINEPRITENAGKHSHTGTTDSAGKSTTFDNRPKYYRLAFITKKSQSPQAERFKFQFVAPNGGIVMWSGDPQALPNGWRLCDGLNGSPDLRDRFILGVQAGQDPGETGGADAIQLTIDNLPNHNHGFKTNSAGNHSHGYNDDWLDKQGAYFSLFNWGSTLAWPGDAVQFDDTVDAGLHSHTGDTEYIGKGGSFDNRPSFYRLAFIILMTDTIKPSRIPKGAIAMWSEDQMTIPYGWCFCDGVNGTPDLRDRFILGGQTVGETGGENAITLSTNYMPKHKHAFTTKSGGLHDHPLDDHYRETAVFYYEKWGFSYTSNGTKKSFKEKTSMSNDHTHSGTTYEAGGSIPFDNCPAYHKLAFVMRID